MSATVAMLHLTADEAEMVSDLSQRYDLGLHLDRVGEEAWLIVNPASSWAADAIRHLRAVAEARA